jgi:hypothetical protein
MTNLRSTTNHARNFSLPTPHSIQDFMNLSSSVPGVFFRLVMLIRAEETWSSKLSSVLSPEYQAKARGTRIVPVAGCEFNVGLLLPKSLSSVSCTRRANGMFQREIVSVYHHHGNLACWKIEFCGRIIPRLFEDMVVARVRQQSSRPLTI